MTDRFGSLLELDASTGFILNSYPVIPNILSLTTYGTSLIATHRDVINIGASTDPITYAEIDPCSGSVLSSFEHLFSGFDHLLPGVSQGVRGLASDDINLYATAFTGFSYLPNTIDVYSPPAPDPIPEPTTLLLLSTGLAGMGAYGLKRKRKPSNTT